MVEEMFERRANGLSRRNFLRMIVIASPGIALAACAPAAVPPPTATEPTPTIPTAPGTDLASTPEDEAATAQPVPSDAALPALIPTPACGDDDEPTPPQTAGPFYTPNTPRRNSFLEPGISGTRMIITGYVLDTACRPIPGAMLDFWHCDDAGVYDNTGYKLRGHFFADEAGRYTLETIQPGIYPGRTRHFHVRVQAPNQPVLTTQLYFPNEPLNVRDRIFRPECLMDVRDNADGSKTGVFNFILRLS
jgi:protocatechuate 3,4-dioxygenase beta subunit